MAARFKDCTPAAIVFFHFQWPADYNLIYFNWKVDFKGVEEFFKFTIIYRQDPLKKSHRTEQK